jgi:RNA polymerase sigma-54 factor
LNDKFLSKEDREYLKQKISDAQTFQGSLEMREKTIERIAELIMIEQHDFWANGVNSLKPMTMAQVAEQLGVHEATVSRACSGKYILTPQGLLEFKYFFSHGVKSSDGVELSNLAVKEKIRHYIDTEDAEKPLSDEKIASLLKSANINISRRTVAKYRDSMNIAPAHKRKTIFLTVKIFENGVLFLFKSI